MGEVIQSPPLKPVTAFCQRLDLAAGDLVGGFDVVHLVAMDNCDLRLELLHVLRGPDPCRYQFVVKTKAWRFFACLIHRGDGHQAGQTIRVRNKHEAGHCPRGSLMLLFLTLNSPARAMA